MEIPQILQGFSSEVAAIAGGLLSLSASVAVHIAQAKYVGTRPQVTKCAFYPLAEVSASALEKVRKDAQLDDARFTTLLSANEYQLMMVDAPNVPVDELKTAIRWKIKDSLSYHVDDATIDVLQIPTNKYGSDRPQSLYAVAASNETIRKRIALFEKARIELSVIDIPETAQRNIAALFEMEGARSGDADVSATRAACSPSLATASCFWRAVSISRWDSCRMRTRICASSIWIAWNWKCSVRWITSIASSITFR